MRILGLFFLLSQIAWATTYSSYPFGDFHWKSPAASVAALPASGNQPGDMRIALDTFNIYLWNGSAWVDQSGGGGTVTAVTASSPLASSGGATPNITCAVASGAQAGCLSASSYTTFNGKQAPGDNTADERHVDLFAGNDSTGTGSAMLPWKTIQKACTALTGVATINQPYTVYISGGNNDSDAAPITCPPNVNLIAEYGIQINQNFTITGGSTNDQSTFQNVIFTGSFTWVRNDATAIQVNMFNTEVSGLLDFEQQGSGVSQSFLFMLNGGIAGGATIEASQVDLLSAGIVSGTINYKDSGAAFLLATGNDLFGSVFQFHGGITAEFSGNIADSGYSISGTTTGSGTPTLLSDSGSLPPPASITGSFTVSRTAFSNWVDFTNGVQVGTSNGVPSATNVLLEVKDGHMKSSQTTAPTTTVKAAAGTGASCAVSHATDSAGTIQITFGSASFSSGDQCDINFNKAYSVAPICNITPANASAASDMGSNHQVYVSSTTAVTSINYGLAQNSAGAVNQWNYRCMETQ